MEFHGPIIRPGTDADSVFIEVTAGCTHNGCTFCNFYRDTPFYVAPFEQIEKDLQEAKQAYPNAKKVWASGGKPFALSTEKLIALGKLISKYYPDAIVSTYARIDDVMIGIDSGDDAVLSFVNKGYIAKDIVTECQKLDEATFPYRMIYLGRLAGKGNLFKVLEKVHIYSIRFILTI